MGASSAVLLGLAGVLYGLDKSLAPGAGMLAVAFLAGVIPAHEATGVTLLMAIVADWSAIWAYRKNVSTRSLTRLLPFALIGIACGAAYLFVADDTSMKRVIGVILAVFVGMYFVNLGREKLAAGRGSVANKADAAAAAEPIENPTFALIKRVGCGALAGFTTMVANAGGPVTAIFFLSEKLSVLDFLGTTAWFYLIANLVKLPFSIGLGMITPQLALSIVWIAPVILLTVVTGRAIAKRVDKGAFTVLVYVLSIAAVVKLFL